MKSQKTTGRGSKAAEEEAHAEPQMDEVGVAAVNRALAILDSFTEEASVLTLAQISQKTGLYKSTILRLLQSLEAYGYVYRTNSGSYVLGPTPVRLSSLATKALHPAELVMPVLRELVQATSESASFFVRSGAMRLCAYRVDSPRSIRDHVQIGQLLPLDKGAAGHVLTDFENFLHAGVARSANKLVRISRGERDAETAALACPVFGAENKLEGSLGLSGPINRFNEAAVKAMTPHLLHAAKTLTASFLGDPAIFAAAS